MGHDWRSRTKIAKHLKAKSFMIIYVSGGLTFYGLTLGLEKGKK